MDKSSISIFEFISASCFNGIFHNKLPGHIIKQRNHQICRKTSCTKLYRNSSQFKYIADCFHSSTCMFDLLLWIHATYIKSAFEISFSCNWRNKMLYLYLSPAKSGIQLTAYIRNRNSNRTGQLHLIIKFMIKIKFQFTWNRNTSAESKSSCRHLTWIFRNILILNALCSYLHIFRICNSCTFKINWFVNLWNIIRFAGLNDQTSLSVLCDILDF